MKIEQLLVQHFYQHRQITLQGLGTFTLSPDIALPADNDKDSNLPENAISFVYNPRAQEDDELISFIVQQTRKIRPLASADLDSYLVLGKQFLNIGKPFTIEGLGQLEKNQNGEYQFRQGHYSNARIEAAPAALREKADDQHVSFAAPAPRSSGFKPILKYGLIAIGLVGMATAAWFVLKNRKAQKNTVASEQPQPAPAPVKTDTAAVTTAPAVKKDSLAAPVTDGYTFRIVFKETINKAAALARMDDLTRRGHHVIMFTKDSLTYKLAEPFKLPLTDTAHIRDSLNKFYYSNKAYVEVY
ncbi:MAG: hypothetical protein U0X40_04045 [Ferruginibacter sp.]